MATVGNLPSTPIIYCRFPNIHKPFLKRLISSAKNNNKSVLGKNYVSNAEISSFSQGQGQFRGIAELDG